ncbi:nuclear pore complex NUP205 [Olea europaea subsp. europaea]|uniref:Nuclear pore complex NUP205 n=1 Tax=Olea europaea subsp. europaea TaxID=158383 RepID=A0A8S0QFP8_OLEEU|nr:nuclear pore complex NUP205 [Olea europaea subsp. europaea]
MVSSKQLLSIIESALLGPTPPTPSQRIELIHAIRHSLPAFKSLFSFPPPKQSDRAQVQLKEVRLPDTGPISLDDQDVWIALKLSDDLHLNEIDCVQLLVSANQEWGLLGREPLDILRLAAGLWYTERRSLITALYTLLRAVVLDQGFEADLVADIQKYLEDLISAGLRHRLISLMKELNREEPTGIGGPNSEHYILDSRGSLVERRAVICRERLILGHCLVLSALIEHADSKDIKDMFFALKDGAVEYSGSTDSLEHQITYSLLFSLVIALVSDALSTGPDKVPVLSSDISFRREFQEIVMTSGNDPTVEGFVDCVRFAWVVHLMLIQDGRELKESVASALSNEMKYTYSCLEAIFANNVFQFYLDKILRTAAYQNDDEDMIYMYNAYLHKQITCFLSHPLARDKVKEAKEKAMTMLNQYRTTASHSQTTDGSGPPQQSTESAPLPFVSLLEFVSEIYQKEPELLSGNDVLWTFVKFAGEDHTNVQTLVAFLKMLSTLACNPEGAAKIFELLNGKTFRSIGWSTLFDCLSIYEEKFKQSLQSPGAMFPEFQEGDAKALVAYLNVLQKVVENGNPIERKNWFPDIKPLFKLLSYENVPPYLKGALRNAIATFVHASPLMKDAIWSYLEQYDLPVVIGPNIGNSGQPVGTQVYDMQFELNEIEARREQYPSTISFINLLNVLIAEERNISDRGHRFIGIFRFIYDHVFSPFPQRAYADPCDKWQLVVACLKHFQMMLSMYDVREEDVDIVGNQSQLSGKGQSSPQMHLPAIELMKDFMSGRTAFRNIMSILLPGVNFLITERTSQIYGQLLEKAVLLSLEIIILVMEKDLIVSDFLRPLYQPLEVILSQDHNQIVALLEYVRYDFLPQVQRCSIKILSILSSRMVGLSQLLLKSNAAGALIEDYAACLELRSEESQIIEESSEDPGVLIMQLLIDNISRPAPNITHLLLRFDVDSPVERTVLQPKFHYSCLKVILDVVDKLSKPEVNALLHEFGFQQLLYELCVDPLTSSPTMDLLATKKYQFFVKHLSSIGVAPLPKRNSSQALRICSLHQRAWLLKLLAVELHSADVTSALHRETCQSILAQLFGQSIAEYRNDGDSFYVPQNNSEVARVGSIGKIKVLELLEVVQFKCPDSTLKSSQFVSNLKYSSLAEDILTNPATSGKGGVYYFSERGDRLIDLASFRDKLCQKCNLFNPQMSSFTSEAELNEVREVIQQLLRWGWKYNKNLEEQAAQLHMLTSWSQIVEVSVSQKISFLDTRSEILFQLLDASLNASGSPDCSLKMALILTQVGLTCMAKLRVERFSFGGCFNSETVTCLDIISTNQLSNGACHSIFFKLIMAILRLQSSEALRRRQYALMLNYFHYCRHTLDPDVPPTLLQFLSIDEQDNGDLDLEKIDKDQAELAHMNFAILKKEAQQILNLVIKDATQGSESAKTISIYVLDALICIDHEKFFLSQLQSRGFLRACFLSISTFSYEGGRISLNSMKRVCTLEAELSLLLRVSHKYGKSGAQVLFSMGLLEHIASCKALNLQAKGTLRRIDTKIGRYLAVDVDEQRMIIAPILRLVFSLTSLVDTSEFFEVNNKVVREVIEFIKGHQVLFDQILRVDISDANELTLEQINLVVGILGKVWPYEESDEYGFVQGLFGMMRALFSRDPDVFTSMQSVRSEIQRKVEANTSRLCFNLSSYLYFLVTKKSLRLQVSDGPIDYSASAGQQQPTLTSLSHFLRTLATALERAAEEKYILLNKIKDINELSRQEVDEIINMYITREYVSSSENTQKRRYIAMVEMCQIVGHRNQFITLLLLITQNAMNIILTHFQDSSYAREHYHSLKAIGYGDVHKEDLHSLCEELTPVLERLELLSEDKMGQDLKVFCRLAHSLKEMSFQILAT